MIHQDPVLSQVKLIAEPWDVGPGGYQVGNFPILWSEWNGVYRDTMRDFWRGVATPASSPRARPARPTSTRPTAATRSRRSTSSPRTTASRCATSSPTTTSTTRPTSRTTTTAPTTTARGTAASRATPTTPRSLPLRFRQQRNFLATLLLSQGTPMLLGGDEIGRTQRGNNNGWCQDNEISWFRLEQNPEKTELREFTRRLIALRREHQVFRQRAASCAARRSRASGLPDVWWFRADGQQDDPPRLAGRRARARDVPQRRRDRRPPARRDRTSRTTRSCCCSTPSPRIAWFTLPRRRFGRAMAARAFDRRPGRRAGQRALRRPDRGERHRAVGRGAEAGHVNGRPAAPSEPMASGGQA